MIYELRYIFFISDILCTPSSSFSFRMRGFLLSLPSFFPLFLSRFLIYRFLSLSLISSPRQKLHSSEVESPSFFFLQYSFEGFSFSCRVCLPCILHVRQPFSLMNIFFFFLFRIFFFFLRCPRRSDMVMLIFSCRCPNHDVLFTFSAPPAPAARQRRHHRLHRRRQEAGRHQ